MELSRCQPRQQKVYSRKRKRVGLDGNVGPNKQNWSYNGGIDRLPDDVLINILSRTSLKESARASVLARRWRDLWRFTDGILRFDHTDLATGNVMEREKFESWVNTVLKLHQARYVKGMVISFDAGEDDFLIHPTRHAVDNWVFLATQKEVQRFELNILNPPLLITYIFPSVERLISHYNGVMSSPFCRLRTLRLANVNIDDEVVHYFLASCLNLEELCIQSSYDILHLRVIDPPSLRVLEISECYGIESVEISTVNLVSFIYRGSEEISLVLNNIPNLRELIISGKVCESFIIEPEELWSFSVQLEKLVLDFRPMYYVGAIVGPTHLPQLCSLKRMELQIYTSPGRSLLFHTPLIEAAPQLREFRIELSYMEFYESLGDGRKPFSDEEEADAVKFVHTNLKVVEMSGYIACSSEKELLLELFKIGRQSIERVVIDTESDSYYDQPTLKRYAGVATRSARNKLWNELRSFGVEATTRDEAKMRAKDLALVLPKQAKLIVT